MIIIVLVQSYIPRHSTTTKIYLCLPIFFCLIGMKRKDNFVKNILSESSQYQQTYRRVKDCCAHLYNLTQSWSSLNSIAFDTASKLMNSLIKYNMWWSLIVMYWVILKKRLEGKIVEKYVKLHIDLCNMLLQMVGL